MDSNYVKAVRFEKPDYIPMFFCINDSCWHHYPQDQLFDLMEEHKLLFPDFVRPKGKYIPNYRLVARAGEPYTDDFGCVWTTTENGITGTVTEHPLKDWEAFKTYQPPDPRTCMGIGPIDWEEVEKDIKAAKEKGDYVGGELRHGHTFLQLCDLRGYENLLMDMANEEGKLWELIDMVEEFNAFIVERYLSFGVDQFSYPEDLGMQYGPMLPPAYFLKYIKPSYQRLMKPALDKGIIVHMHSDGDIKALADDLIDSGVQIINLQDLVNGIDWISNRYRGKICIDIDIDRQKITPFGTPKQIDELIKEEVEKLSTPQGGLIMTYGLYPNVPIENIKAIMDAMEKYAFYYD
ncbi:MAG: hypothetical protein GX766_04315 [Firmicutes bacterium]|nr:hypothetical protein [Bacillota bacterium]